MPVKLVDDPKPLGPKLNDIPGMLRLRADRVEAGAYEDLVTYILIGVNESHEIISFGVVGQPLNKLESKGALIDSIKYLQAMDDPVREPSP